MLHDRVIATWFFMLIVLLSLLSLHVPQLLFTAWIALVVLAVFTLARAIGQPEISVSLRAQEEEESIFDELISAASRADIRDEELEKMIFEEAV